MDPLNKENIEIADASIKSFSQLLGPRAVKLSLGCFTS